MEISEEEDDQSANDLLKNQKPYFNPQEDEGSGRENGEQEHEKEPEDQLMKDQQIQSDPGEHEVESNESVDSPVDERPMEGGESPIIIREPDRDITMNESSSSSSKPPKSVPGPMSQNFMAMMAKMQSQINQMQEQKNNQQIEFQRRLKEQEQKSKKQQQRSNQKQENLMKKIQTLKKNRGPTFESKLPKVKTHFYLMAIRTTSARISKQNKMKLGEIKKKTLRFYTRLIKEQNAKSQKEFNLFKSTIRKDLKSY